MRPFRKAFAGLAFACLVLCAGCYRYYTVKLTNGAQFGTIGKPKLDPQDGAYHYTDGKGRKRAIAAGHVAVIQPTAMAEQEEENSRLKPASTKKKHWYWPF